MTACNKCWIHAGNRIKPSWKSSFLWGFVCRVVCLFCFVFSISLFFCLVLGFLIVCFSFVCLLLSFLLFRVFVVYFCFVLFFRSVCSISVLCETRHLPAAPIPANRQTMFQNDLTIIIIIIIIIILFL